MHVNPDGRDLDGKRVTEMTLLNIYGQPDNHMEAVVVGNRRGLEELKRVIEETLDHQTRHTTSEVFASDGEGYQTHVILAPDDWHDPFWTEAYPFYHWRMWSDLPPSDDYYPECFHGA